MKIRLFLLTSLFALAALPGLQAQAPGNAAKRDFDTPIGDNMDKMRTAMNGLRNQVSDSSKNADSLAKVAALRQAATEAKKHEPVRAKDVPSGEKAKFLSDYRADMDNLIALAGKLETALKANNNAEAAKLFEEIGNAQKAGHKSYKKGKKKAA